jgi:hypothetical protein
MWDDNFQEAEPFSWINTNDVKWLEVETTAELMNIKTGQSVINVYQLFDYICWVRQLITQKAGNWEKDTISCEEEWVQIFKHFNEQNIPLPNIVKVTVFVFSFTEHQHLQNVCSDL